MLDILKLKVLEWMHLIFLEVATRPLHHPGGMANYQLAAACRFLVGILASGASFSQRRR
jgi:hypothetical protein